jgi:hypothetical protein
LKEAVIAEEESDTLYVIGLKKEVKLHNYSVDSRDHGQNKLHEENKNKLLERIDKI